MGDHNFFGDRPQHNGTNLALITELGGAGDHIVPLDEDEHAESTAITSYPAGISIMPASAVADWFDFGIAALVKTHRDGSSGAQVIFFPEYEQVLTRYYFSGAWSNTQEAAPSVHTHTNIEPLTTDAFAESAAITSYPEGISIMPVTGGANWGPNTGQAGHVLTERNGSEGKQTFHQYSNATSYERTYTGGAWGSWSTAGAGAPAAHAASHTWGGSDALRPSLRALQTVTDGATVAVGTDEIILIAGSPDIYNLVMAAGSFDGQRIHLVNRSVNWLHFNPDSATSRIGNPPLDIGSVSVQELVWDANFAGVGSGRWSKAKHTNLNSVRGNSIYTENASDLTIFGDGLTVLRAAPGLNWGPATAEGGTVYHWRQGTEHTQLYLGYAGTLAWRYHNGTSWTSWDEASGLIPADAQSESAVLTNYKQGYSLMPVSSGANWGPNTGEVGHVVIERNGSVGKQTFHQYSNATSYERTYTGGTWGAWAQGIKEGDSRLTNARTPTAHASTHTNGTDDIQDATAAQKGLATAAQITKLDAIEAGATDDSGLTDHINDTTDAHDASAISYAGGTGMSATDLEAAVDELATEKANAGAAPTAHATSHQPGGSDAMAVDGAAATGSLRTLGTGAAQAAAGNDARLSDARSPTTREWMATFFYGGNLAAQVGVGGEPVPNSGTPTITEVSVYVDTKPTTQNVIVDINSVNLSTGVKTTLYTTQGNRPQITPGGNFRVNATLPDIVAPGVGSVLTADIDQVGSGTVGANLTVKVRGTF